MEATKEPDKCKHCAANVPEEDDEEGERYVCDLCKEALYCSDECASADFLLHRDSCKGRERALAMQKQCYTCDKRVEQSEEHCTVCKRIKYCSAACKSADKEIHASVCSAYAELAPRPSKDHRICILFPADEQKLRLLWVPTDDSEAMRAIVAPEGLDMEVSGGPRIDFDDELDDYRGVWFYSVESFLFHPHLAQNQSLGLITVGHPLMSVRGSLLMTVSEYVENEGTRSDISPGDILPVLHHFMQAEARHGFGIEVQSYSSNSEGDLVPGDSACFSLPHSMM